MKPKDCITIPSGEVGRCGSALRKHLKNTNQFEKLLVVELTKFLPHEVKASPELEGMGRVWLWPRDEKTKAKAPQAAKAKAKKETAA